MIAVRKTISARWLALAAFVLMPATALERAGVLATHGLLSDSMLQWRLPSRLREISGLALDAEERLFAVADEKAVVYELDLHSHRVKKAFAFGDPVLRGDFEGIAIVGADFYLISSNGKLYRAKEGGDGEQVTYAEFDTGLANRCEVEGLANAGAHLLIACKQTLQDGPEALPVFSWSLAQQSLDEAATLELPLRAITEAIGERRISPSGIAVDPDTGNRLLVAARQRALIEMTAAGGFIAALRLPLAARHRQPEGIELMRDGRLLIADEGGNHKSRLAVYARDIEPGAGAK